MSSEQQNDETTENKKRIILKQDTYQYYLRSKNTDRTELYERMRQNINTEIIAATTLLIVLGTILDKYSFSTELPKAILIIENVILIFSITFNLLSNYLSQKSGEISLEMLDSWLNDTYTRIDQGLDRLSPNREQKLDYLAYSLGIISTTLLIIALIIFSIISIYSI